ncbi:DNA binding methylated-DNA--cysteine S-methyltransferase [Myriangium duriaei CBS 260.36]|uniref:DNA binding methylated-DNA--cysteine S-methyltransferase n=1 Tax=Myriangium duriaei CBS 260.36 TaxID=1168546 RepID=A0A9P4J6N2_9PEZI|nr:DNA binding methylated-DNA--cysteine S-methyltransferase [Myriangium duriaei CBS 260.36]
MPQSEEAAAWFHAVYTAVQEIPHGRVTSYGHIARLVGRPERPRQVGVCLKHLPDASKQPNNPFNNNTVPWQRVINSRGSISPRGPNGASRQASALRREGVTIETGTMGELTVDFEMYGWFPEMLPSEAAEVEDDSDED